MLLFFPSICREFAFAGKGKTGNMEVVSQKELAIVIHDIFDNF